MTIKYTVSGIVQGVGFRYFIYKNAIELGLKGYVKNLLNGDVEIVAQGDEIVLENLLKIIERGTIHSTVKEIIKENINNENEFLEFRIK